MGSWRKGEGLTARGNSCFLRRASFVFFLLGAFAGAQTTDKPASKKVSVHRANELTLAGLRPGRDTATRAIQLYKRPSQSDSHTNQLSWGASCQAQTLFLDLDSDNTIRVIRAIETSWSQGECRVLAPGPWKTGRGLGVGDVAEKVVVLYGEPESRSPSTKDGQPLELMYYAFDWAGPDVPQVMEVVCTKGAQGKPGRVTEITLAAPSL
jgi:hypothetical protein